jgi:vesicle transport through interaction with t-SNAREs protein 1
LEEDYNKSKIKPNPLIIDDSSSIDDFEVGLGEDQKRRLLDNSERLERTGNRLEDGYRIAVETEEVRENLECFQFLVNSSLFLSTDWYTNIK